MPTYPSELTILARVARERLHGCLYAYTHAESPQEKSVIVRQVVAEMQRPLDMMGVNLPMAKEAFGAHPLHGAFKPPRPKLTELGEAVSREGGGEVFELFTTAAKLWDVKKVNMADFVDKVKAYNARVAAFNGELRSLDSSWRVLAAAEPRLTKEASELKSLRCAISDMASAANEEHVTNADLVAWHTQRQFDSIIALNKVETMVESQKHAFLDREQRLHSVADQKIAAFERYVQRREGGESLGSDRGDIQHRQANDAVLAWSDLQSERPENERHPAASDPCRQARDKIAALKGRLDRLDPAAARRPAAAPTPVSVPVAPRPQVRVRRPARDAAPTMPVALAEATLPAGEHAAFSASQREILSTCIDPVTNLPRLTILDTATRAESQLRSLIDASDMEINQGLAMIVGHGTSQVEFIREQGGRFAGAPIHRTTHGLASSDAIGLYNDRAVVASKSGEVELFKVTADGAHSMGAFKAHNRGVAKVVVGDGFFATVPMAGEEISIWSTARMPKKSFFKPLAEVKLRLAGTPVLAAAEGKYLFYNLGDNVLHRREIDLSNYAPLKKTQLPEGEVPTALGVSKGWVGLATEGAVQVWDTKELVARPRLELPGMDIGMVVPANDRVHVYTQQSNSIRTFSLGA